MLFGATCQRLIRFTAPVSRGRTESVLARAKPCYASQYGQPTFSTWQSRLSQSRDDTSEKGTENAQVAVQESDLASSSSPDSQSTPETRSSPLNPKASHNSLQTFIAHAVRTGLSQTSTVYTGTRYEYLAQNTLRSYGFDLHRVGGRGDRGVDLIGVWRIPVLNAAGNWKAKQDVAASSQVSGEISELDLYETESLKILVQCKRYVGKTTPGPNLVRELDGAVRGARSSSLFHSLYPQLDPDSQASAALGIMVSTRTATKGIIDGMRRSARGLIWITMDEVAGARNDAEPRLESGDDDIQTDATADNPDEQSISNNDEIIDSSPPNLRGRVRQMLWNQAARELGLEGVDIVKRFDSSGHEQAVLMRGGRVWG
jgi:hypothetical protein